MTRWLRRHAVLIAPPMVAASVVLTAYGASAAGPLLLVRPMLVAVVLTAGMTALIAVVMRTPAWAAVVGVVAVLLVSRSDIALPALVVAVLWANARAWGRVDIRALKALRSAPAPSLEPLIVAGVILVTTLPAAVHPQPTFHSSVGSSLATLNGRPNIYVLLLDGYGRSDTLAELGLDNRPFLNRLESLGFEVVANAQSSYGYTIQNVVSMLHGRHVADLPIEVPSDFTAQKHLAKALIDWAPVLSPLREIGYRVVSIPAGMAGIGFHDADEVIIPSPMVNELEHHLLRQTQVDLLLRTQLHHWHGETVSEALQSWVQARPGPSVTIAHVLSPHTPFVWESDGSWAEPLNCYPATCEFTATQRDLLGLTVAEYGRRYADQVVHLNSLVTSALGELIDRDPSAVIVVLGDHGVRMETDDPDEWYRILFAARTPGHPGLFNDHGHATAVFPGILRAHFAADLDWPAMVRYTWGPGPLDGVVREGSDGG